MENFETIRGSKERNQMRYCKDITNKPFIDFGKNFQEERGQRVASFFGGRGVFVFIFIMEIFKHTSKVERIV